MYGFGVYSSREYLNDLRQKLDSKKIAERELYFLADGTLVKIKLEAQKGGVLDIAALSCTVVEIDGAPVSLNDQREHRAAVSVSSGETITAQDHQAVMEEAFNRWRITHQRVGRVSEEYARGHLKLIRLKGALRGKEQ